MAVRPKCPAGNKIQFCYHINYLTRSENNFHYCMTNFGCIKFTNYDIKFHMVNMRVITDVGTTFNNI